MVSCFRIRNDVKIWQQSRKSKLITGKLKKETAVRVSIDEKLLLIS